MSSQLQIDEYQKSCKGNLVLSNLPLDYVELSGSYVGECKRIQMENPFLRVHFKFVM